MGDVSYPGLTIDRVSDAYLEPFSGGSFTGTPDPSKKYRVKSTVNVRNAPTTSGTQITGQKLAGDLVDGVMVMGSQPHGEWLELAKDEGYLWAGPLELIESAPATEFGFQEEYRLPNNTGRLLLPERARVLIDKTGCSKAEKKAIKKIVPKKTPCVGSVEYRGAKYVVTQNWEFSEQSLGFFRLIDITGKARPIGAISTSGQYGFIMATEWNGDTLEIVSGEGSPDDPDAFLPYLRYRVVGSGVSKRLDLIDYSQFPEGQTPIDKNRVAYAAALSEAESKKKKKKKGGGIGGFLRRLVTPVEQPTSRSAASSSRSQSSTRSQSSRNNRRSSNSACNGVRWQAPVENVADLFLCDETRAVEFFAEGAEVVFDASTTSFRNGQFIASMSQLSSRARNATRNMQRDFNWQDWNTRINAKSFRVSCVSSRAVARKGQRTIVFAKLQNYSGAGAVVPTAQFTCS